MEKKTGMAPTRYSSFTSKADFCRGGYHLTLVGTAVESFVSSNLPPVLYTTYIT